MVVDLREIESGQSVTVTLANGEEYSGIVVDKDNDYADDYTKGYVRFAFEGDWWDRVKDRVDTEVLDLSQEFARVTGEPQTVSLAGTVWVGDVEDASVPRYKDMGEVVAVEVNDE